MRSGTELRAAALAALLAMGPAGEGPAAQPLPAREQVQAAAERTRADPNLPATQKQTRLRFKPADRDVEQDKPGPDLGWLRSFMAWLSETARVLVWLAGALAVALMAVGIRRWVRARAQASLPPRPGLPSHVRDLDIRPESLPEDIGAAAAALWQRGEHRAALSLLYRGALSCLVHRDQVPIREASTEGECLALAASRLDAARSAFLARLVAAWQLAVYGARLPATEQVMELCRQFAPHLQPPAREGNAP